MNARHESGAYYTPRPVVSFMCREALKSYHLATHCISPHTRGEISDRHLRRRSRLHRLSPHKQISVRDALRKITVVDPACGSGAYLLGMMQELVELYNCLSTVIPLRSNPNYLYDLKLHIIERNLYGADKDGLRRQHRHAPPLVVSHHRVRRQ